MHIYTQSEKKILPKMETILESLSNLGRQGKCHVITNCFSLVWGQIGNCHKFVYIYLTNISVSFTILLHSRIIWYFHFYIWGQWHLPKVQADPHRNLLNSYCCPKRPVILLSNKSFVRSPQGKLPWVTWPKNVTLIKGYIWLMCLLLTGLHCTCQASNF